MQGADEKRIGIILAGHGSWPAAMKESLDMIMGEQDKIALCPVTDVESAEQIQRRMKQNMEQLGDCEGYLFLLDLFGGSPSHAVVSLGLRDDVLALTGANLSMLIQAVSIRDETGWPQLGAILVQTGQDAVRNLLEELRQLQ